MKKNPVATITFSNGSVIQIELYPDIAPNAVTSFIYLAKQGVYDHYPIERIVPGWVLDMSYHAFHNPKACYFIPNDVKSGKIVNGMEEIRRLEQLETYPVPYPGEPNVKINTPVYTVFIEQIQIETFGVSYGEPTRLTGIAKPLFWPCVSP